jgi:hypothetical protein
MPRPALLRSIELLATVVAPAVRKAIGSAKSTSLSPTSS